MKDEKVGWGTGAGLDADVIGVSGCCLRLPLLSGATFANAWENPGFCRRLQSGFSKCRSVRLFKQPELGLRGSPAHLRLEGSAGMGQPEG